jgi:hypothetical protein
MRYRRAVVANSVADAATALRCPGAIDGETTGGAVATAFLFPILLADIGTRALLFILVGTSLLGAVVTWLFRIETTGVSLKKIGS